MRGVALNTRDGVWARSALLLAAAAAVAAAAGVPNAWLLLLLAPLLEESIFRAGLQEQLLQHGVGAWSANVITAVAFGATHVVAHGTVAAIAVIAPALAIGFAYQVWRRLRICVGLHAGMNALWIAVVM